MSKNKYKELGKNTAIFAVSLLLSKLVSSLLVPLYTRTLTTEEYGIADLVTTIVGFVVPICSLSIHEAVFRFTIDTKYNRNRVLQCGINVAWIASLFMIIVGQLFKLYAPVSAWTTYVILISILSTFRNIISLFTEANGRVTLFGIDNVVCNFVLGLANIAFLVIFGLGLKGYFFATIVSLVCSILLLVLFGKVSLIPRYQIGDFNIVKTMIQYSAPLVFNSVSWILMGLIDRMMLTSLYTSSANGIYAVASKIPTLLTVITSVFTQAWGLSLIKDYDNDKDETFYNNVYDLFHMIAILGTSGILLFTNNVFRFIIGEEFSEAVKYIAVLMMGTVFLTYSNFFSSVYSAAKKSSIIALSSAGGLVVNVILNAILIPRMGIMGACIATTGSYIFIGIYRMIDCRKYINFNFDIVRWILSIVLLTIQCIVVSLNYFDVFASIVILAVLAMLYHDLLYKVVQKIKGGLNRKKNVKS